MEKSVELKIAVGSKNNFSARDSGTSSDLLGGCCVYRCVGEFREEGEEGGGVAYGEVLCQCLFMFD